MKYEISYTAHNIKKQYLGDGGGDRLATTSVDGTVLE